MSHILLIRSEPTLPPNLRDVFAAPENRIVIRQSPAAVKSAIERGAFSLAVIYVDCGEAVMRRNLRELRGLSTSLFTVALGTEQNLSEETAAFDEGADLYFAEPLPTESLRRLFTRQQEPVAKTEAACRTDSPTEPIAQNPRPSSASTLHTLRDLSHILSYSLDYKAFTQHFILKLRDHISFSRVAIFLESSVKQSLIKGTPAHHLECIASIGLPSDLIDCFQLSRDVGMGREIIQHPRILHKNSKTHSPFIDLSATIEKEFSILGCHVAVPISDREGPIGVAVLNGPVTGRAYTDDELELLYVLMEELGLAVHNSRLHSELAQHGQLIENVLCSMSSGALVCGEELDVLYANETAKRFLRGDSKQLNENVEFAELPGPMAGAVHRAVEKGEKVEPFQITGSGGEAIYRISIFPFSPRGELSLPPQPTMIIMEDYTKIEANKRNAVDDTRSETISLIAERFAHEIRNSLVPLSTHAQLIEKKIEQPKFQASLKSALEKETTRIKRFSDQMLYMAQSSRSGSESVDLLDLIKTAFERARTGNSNPGTKLKLENHSETRHVNGNGESLGHALEEIFLNSMQTLSKPGEIAVKLRQNNEGILQIRIKDDGPGIPEDVVEDATKPFYTTRNTGIGLGLSVAEKIFSEHNGYLKLYPRSAEQGCDIEIELPLLLTTV